MNNMPQMEIRFTERNAEVTQDGVEIIVPRGAGPRSTFVLTVLHAYPGAELILAPKPWHADILRASPGINVRVRRPGAGRPEEKTKREPFFTALVHEVVVGFSKRALKNKSTICEEVERAYYATEAKQRDTSTDSEGIAELFDQIDRKRFTRRGK
jgi:hypothetical protein